MEDYSSNNWMDFMGLLLFFIIFLLFGSVSAPVANGTVGQSVYLLLNTSSSSEVFWRMEKSNKSIIAARVPALEIPAYNPSYSERCQLFDNGTLKLEDITYRDRGNYTVDVFDLKEFTFRTEEYDLHICPHLLAPILKPVNQTFLNGTSVTLQCDAGNQTVTSYTFDRDGHKNICSEPHVSCKGSTLVFTPITETDKGSYTCTIHHCSHTITSGSMNLTVSWYPKGNILCTAQNHTGNDTVGCSWPGGNPAANVTIFYNATVSLTLFNTVYLSVTKFIRGSNFTCIGTQLGKSSSCILILEPPQCPQHDENSEIDVVEGKTAVLTLNLQPELQSRNRPSLQVLPANFSWFYEADTTPIKNDEKFKVTTNNHFSSLRILRVTKMDSGNYLCKVKNIMGDQDFSFTLNAKSRELNVDAIAGIVIGILIAVITIGVVTYFILKRKKVKPKALVHEKRNAPPSHIYENTAPGAKQMEYPEESLYCNVLAGRKN
ncbi:carcinoembryonic antigen-related cell adhesion molecule 1-like [Ranitomeya imitator]|uniref:carcinoembryonic antigen-related cell adhesion molecule 1-like n=1 Tax=Ranitomeya imitator TaxID=111125 RepID=UPI0037E71EEA